jgi:hypothetical protein
MATEDLLDKAVAELGFSRDFCERCKMMHLGTLKEIVAVIPQELVRLNGFSYHWLAELSDCLNRQGMLHLLQPIPGRNRGRSAQPSGENNP